MHISHIHIHINRYTNVLFQDISGRTAVGMGSVSRMNVADIAYRGIDRYVRQGGVRVYRHPILA